MAFGPDKVTVIEANAGLRDHLAKILTDAGYQVAAESAVTLKTVLETAPDVIVMGANPPQLDCCDLLADLKGSEQTRHIRVIMVAIGGSGERVRGLELGADDVLSLPLEDRELLARVRAQLREKRPEDQLRERVRNDRQLRQLVRRVLHVADQGRRTLRLNIAIAAFALAGLALITFLYSRSQRQNLRVYAALAKLQTRTISELKLVDSARMAKTHTDQNTPASTAAERQSLEQQNKELHDKMATADPSQVAELEKQLRASNQRLQRLESESTVGEKIIRTFSSSVCLLHVVVGFRDRMSGLTLRYTTLSPPSSAPGNGSGEVQVQIGGIGAAVSVDAFGTGFLVSADGHIVTNHHVVEPWWHNDEIGQLLKQVPNIEPVVSDMTAYFPGIRSGIPLRLQKISSQADIALLTSNISGLNLEPLTMDDDPKAAVSGDPVVLIGYPTGIDAILARSDEDALRSIAAETNGDLPKVMAELARRKLIRPLNTQGHIGDVIADKIIYDAQTTSGGSGGPLFNPAGKVIGVNVAVLRDFGGSNFAIPVRYAKRLLVQ